jgi:integrase
MISFPLNDYAIAVLTAQKGLNDVWVFPYQGKPIMQITTKAWRKAVAAIGEAGFRFHDLRHTWASWHVQSGTPLHILQSLGGWSSYEMVLRYAHLDRQTWPNILRI